MGYAGNKTQCPFFKGTHSLDRILNFIKAIDGLEKLPVFIVTEFEDLLNDVIFVLFGIQGQPICIPEQMF